VHGLFGEALAGGVVMPLFGYVCRDCGEAAELLVRAAESPKCPACNGGRLEKQLSRFAPLAAKTPEPAMSCGAPSCCQMQGGCMN